MKNRLKISEKSTKQLNYLSNRLNLRNNIICRIAVGTSLTINESVKNYTAEDSKGLEFNRITLTGDHDLIFKALIVQHENAPIEEEIYFPHFFRNHLERGLDIIYNEYEKINSPVNYLMKLTK
jgi:DNA sulfur modification protein DndE